MNEMKLGEKESGSKNTDTSPLFPLASTTPTERGERKSNNAKAGAWLKRKGGRKAGKNKGGERKREISVRLTGRRIEGTQLDDSSV